MIEVDRNSLSKLAPISESRVAEILELFQGKDHGLISPYYDKGETINELLPLKSELINVVTPEREPVALTALYICRATGYSLKDQVPHFFKMGKMESAIVCDDFADGILGTMMGVFSAAQNLQPKNAGDNVLKTMDLAREYGFAADEITKVTGRISQEEALQARLLAQDPSGTSLVGYWVNVITQREMGRAFDDFHPDRISAFVIKGAQIARDIYALVYPLAEELK